MNLATQKNRTISVDPNVQTATTRVRTAAKGIEMKEKHMLEMKKENMGVAVNHAILRRLSRAIRQVAVMDRTHVGIETLESRCLLSSTVDWSRYVGSTSNDEVSGIVNDSSGNALYCGYSDNVSPIGTQFGKSDVFVGKLSPTGTQPLWSRTIGTTANDKSGGIAIDSANNVYVVGTTSGTFAGQSSHGSDDVFVAKIGANGSLLWVRQFGGSGADLGECVAVDASGSVIVTADIATSTSPLSGATNQPHGGRDGLIAKFTSDGALTWATYLGGSNSDRCYGIAFDSSGSIVVVGDTRSADLAGATNSPKGVSGTNHDWFLAKVTGAGAVQWLAYEGGTGDDVGACVAVESDGSIILAGTSTSSGLPNEIQSYDRNYDVLVQRLAADGTVTWSTHMGWDRDVCNSIAIDKAGGILVAYSTGDKFTYNSSSDWYTLYNSAVNVARIGENGQASWDDLLGNAPWAMARGIMVDTTGAIFLAGFTNDYFKNAVNQAPGESSSNVNNFDGFVAHLTASPDVAIWGASANEGDSGQRMLAFPVTVNRAATQDISVQYSIAAGSAAIGTDFVGSGGTLVIPAGTTSLFLNVPIVGNTRVEPDKTFTVTLKSASGNASVSGALPGIGTIRNDDVGGSIQLSSASYGVNENAGTATITVSRTGGAASNVSVAYTTADGTGQAGNDYTTASGTIVFGANQTSNSFTVPIVDNSLVQLNRTVNLVLSNPQGGGSLGGQTSAVLTIVDDDNANLSIADTTMTEGDAGQTNTFFTVSLSTPTPADVKVQYATANQTALAGSDFVSTTGIVTIPAGQTSATIAVPVNGNTRVDGNRTFALNLSGVTGRAVIARSKAICTIQDNDLGGTVALEASSYRVDENAGQLLVHVTRTGGAASGVAIAYSTNDGAATSGQRYTATSGTLVFGAGEASKTIVIPILNDSILEGDQAMSIALTNPTGGCALGSPATASITIVDDELPTLTVGNVSVLEGDSGISNAVFTVTVNGPSSRDISLYYTTADGTATAGSDYASTSGAITIPAGQNASTIAVPISGDTTVEPDEQFFLNLGSINGATPGSLQAVGTIINDDSAGSFQFSLAAYTGNENTGPVTITATRTNGNAGGVSIQYATVGGTAVAGTDYIATSGTLTYAAGETSKTFAVSLVDDTTIEPDRTVNLVLSNPSNGGTLGLISSAALTIQSDDVPSISVDDVAIPEGNSGLSSAAFTVHLSEAAITDVQVYYVTADGTAVAGSDYISNSGTLLIPAGQTSGTIQVPIIGDTVYESNDTFTLTLSNTVGATVAKSQGTAAIQNDDVGPLATITTGTKKTPIISAQSTVISFGTLRKGATATAMVFTVANKGKLPLTLGAVKLPKGYQIVDKLVTSLAPGRSDTFSVKLITTTPGIFAGQVSFATNDLARNPFVFPVTGKATASKSKPTPFAVTANFAVTKIERVLPLPSEPASLVVLTSDQLRSFREIADDQVLL